MNMASDEQVDGTTKLNYRISVPILYCQPCELEDKCKGAFGYCQTCVEHLCEECYRTHRRPATSRNHVLLDMFNMPKTKVSGQGPSETCEKHEREDIKYLCKDHQALGCSACITIDHRTCKVLYISEVAKGFVNSQEYTCLLQDVERAKQNSLTAKQEALQQVQEIQAEKQTITNEVRAFRQEINSKLDQWEKTLLEENDSVHDNEVTSVEQTISKCEEELQKIGKIEEDLKRLQTSGNNTRLYIQAKKDQHFFRQYNRFIPSRNVTVEFTQNKNTAKMLSEKNGIGSCQSIAKWSY